MLLFNVIPGRKRSFAFNQQRVAECGLCDANYVRYTCRHLYQRVEEHKGSSSIGNHIKEQHGTVPSDIYRDFKILRKCQSKFDCLIYKMLFIKELKPTLNKQPNSIRAKLFISLFILLLFFFYFNTYILELVFTYFIVGHSHALISSYICIFHTLFLQPENDLREIETAFFMPSFYYEIDKITFKLKET